MEAALSDFAISEGLGKNERKSEGSDDGRGDDLPVVASVVEDSSAADSSTINMEEIGSVERCELARIIKLAAAESATKSAHRSLTMLAAAGDFKKFVAMMRLRASELGR